MINKADIKEVLEQVLVEMKETQISEHAEQHEWLAQRIKAERERKLMYRAITKAVIGWSIPFLLTGLAIRFQTGHWPNL